MGLADLSAGPAGQYVHLGVIQVSLTNLLIVAAMFVAFALAVLVPFPHHGDDAPAEAHRPVGDGPAPPVDQRP